MKPQIGKVGRRRCAKSHRSRLGSDGDGELSLCTAAFQLAYGLGYFGKRVRLAHHGSEVTGLDLLTQCFEVSLALVGARDVHGQPLGNHRREHERTEQGHPSVCQLGGGQPKGDPSLGVGKNSTRRDRPTRQVVRRTTYEVVRGQTAAVLSPRGQPLTVAAPSGESCCRGWAYRQGVVENIEGIPAGFGLLESGVVAPVIHRVPGDS